MGPYIWKVVVLNPDFSMSEVREKFYIPASDFAELVHQVKLVAAVNFAVDDVEIIYVKRLGQLPR